MSKFLGFSLVIMCASITVSAQSSNNIKRTQASIEVPSAAVDFAGSERDEQDASVRRISYEYVAPASRKIGVVRVGSSTTYLKRGLTTKDVLQVLGEPAGVSNRVEGGKVVTIYEFQRGGERMLIAEFVQDRLVRTRTETRQQVAQGNR